jgi:hypothetical protein
VSRVRKPRRRRKRTATAQSADHAGNEAVAMAAAIAPRRIAGLDPTAPGFAPAFAAVLVLLVGLPLAAALNIWIDEAFTLHTTGFGVPYAWHESVVFELQPPLYFIIVAAWRLIDESSVLFARFPSIVFAAAGAAVTVVSARRLAPNLPPIALACVTALNPIVIWAAVEMRAYALIFLIGAVLILTFVEGFLAADRSRRAQMWYVIAGVAGLYTQYYVGFVLLAQAISLVAVRRGAVRPFLAAGVAIAVCFAPFLPIVAQHVRESTGGDVRRVSVIRALHEMVNVSFSYALPHDIGWHGYPKLLGFGLAAALAAALLWFGRPALESRTRWLVLFWMTACLTFSAFFAVSGEAIDTRRHAIVLAPAVILAGYALVSALSQRRLQLSRVVLGVYAIFTVGSLWWLYGPPLSKTGDWLRVAQQISASGPNLPVAVFPSNTVYALGWYLPAARYLPIPGPMPFDAKYLAAMTLHDQAQVAAALSSVPHGAEFWLVSDGSCDGGATTYDFHCDDLEGYLSAHDGLLEHLQFHGADVKRFRVR